MGKPVLCISLFSSFHGVFGGILGGTLQNISNDPQVSTAFPTAARPPASECITRPGVCSSSLGCSLARRVCGRASVSKS